MFEANLRNLKIFLQVQSNYRNTKYKQSAIIFKSFLNHLKIIFKSSIIFKSFMNF